jgi:hypothetical protein
MTSERVSHDDDVHQFWAALHDLTTLECFRLVILAICLVVVLEMVFMLANYWWLMRDLRRELGDQVMAPPFWTTFFYHLFVFLLVGLVGIGMVQAIANSAPASLFAYLGPFVLGGLAVVVPLFQRFYLVSLREQRRRAGTLPRPVPGPR